MTAQHAKGPWSRDKYGHVIDADGCDVHFRSMTTLACGSPESMAEAEANTNLAVTAPELLKALQHLFNSYKSLADSGDAGNWRLEDQPEGVGALAAIAKATGQQGGAA